MSSLGSFRCLAKNAQIFDRFQLSQETLDRIVNILIGKMDLIVCHSNFHFILNFIIDTIFNVKGVCRSPRNK